MSTAHSASFFARSFRILFLLLLIGGAFHPALAQRGVTVEADPVDCLPIGDNGIGWATAQGHSPDHSVRLNFRRMNDVVEDTYWVEMNPAGSGRYWGIFPKAADEVLQRHDIEQARSEAQQQYSWADWWRQKDTLDSRDPNQDLDAEMIRERASQGKLVQRHWLAEMDDASFQDWLERLENEPAEFYTSVADPAGREIARSQTMVAEVKSDCRPDLNAEQRGEAENLVIGESAYWQQGELPFHWLCEGIVTRVDPSNVLRGDEVCRACVVAWWDRAGVLAPIGAALAGVAIVGIIEKDDEPLAPTPPPPASPDNP
ncbi:MAG: hypothetical protein MPN21_01340 [Thermoanaerobaculia bacterium]|nr:hypothetical protein [Thermoanaerobaculia bacterium]